jgi:2-polyprenyl-3-methyl-5-hydroxy-6-metoxy-1,4-benzoquinol methylase
LLAYFRSGFKQRVDSTTGFSPFIRFVEGNLPRRGGSLLDLGCGAGAFLVRMQERGFTVSGAEISEPVAQFARDELNLDVIRADAAGAIEVLQRQGRRFDLVTMIHAFEHLPDPLAVLRRLKTILNPAGTVAINVPNVRYPLAAVDLWLNTDMAGIWDPVGHFSYFSSRTLRETCQRAGFEVVASNSRFLAYGRTGVAGFADAIVSAGSNWFGGVGGNISVVARPLV